MNIDTRRENEAKDLKQLEATLERAMEALEKTKDRLNEEVKEAETAINDVLIQIDVREASLRFMDEAIQEREIREEGLQAAFILMLDDLFDDNTAQPDSVGKLKDMLNFKKPALPEQLPDKAA